MLQALSLALRSRNFLLHVFLTIMMQTSAKAGIRRVLAKGYMLANHVASGAITRRCKGKLEIGQTAKSVFRAVGHVPLTATQCFWLQPDEPSNSLFFPCFRWARHWSALSAGIFLMLFQYFMYNIALCGAMLHKGNDSCSCLTLRKSGVICS